MFYVKLFQKQSNSLLPKKETNPSPAPTSKEKPERQKAKDTFRTQKTKFCCFSTILLFINDFSEGCISGYSECSVCGRKEKEKGKNRKRNNTYGKSCLLSKHLTSEGKMARENCPSSKKSTNNHTRMPWQPAPSYHCTV